MRLIAYATCIYAVAASLPAIIALDFSFNPPAANSATFIPQMMLAALGGSYFNIVMNAGKKERDAESAPHATLWECIARVLAALIMGTLTWLFLLSDLVPTLFQKLTHHTFSFIVIAFVAGMFNTFIPSLICKAVQAWQNEKRSEK